jgi:hypothetical protein
MAQSTPGSSVAVKPKREQTVRNDLRSSMGSPGNEDEKDGLAIIAKESLRGMQFS